MKKKLQNDSNIVDLITKIQEQLTSLERKVDSLMNRFLPKPLEVKPFIAPKPFIQHNNVNSQVSVGQQGNHFQQRAMHKAICADCRKTCEVPFRPSAGRPVYCQECFSRRKNRSPFKPNIENRPPVLANHMNKSQANENKKSLQNKKSAEKKKPVSKKPKKGK